VLDTDRKAAIADMRYSYIENVCKQTVVKPHTSREHQRSMNIDKVLTNRIFAIPIFLAIMFLIFWLTFGLIGTPLSDLVAGGIEALGAMVGNWMVAVGVNPVVISLVVDGIFAGVGSVLSFIPTIIVLFFFLSLLEDSGYMARVAFIMDKLLRKLGLSGRSFVPLLIGFGCSVPAIMATRTLTSERDRKMTIFLTPFMSCSAKLPIYSVFTMAFFEEHRALVMISLYVLGMFIGVLFGLLSKATFFRGEPIPFVMELPNYRLPGYRNTLLLLWEKAKDFITRAFTVIFIASIIIWFLQTFDIRFNVVENSTDSMLAAIGHWVAPIFGPLGFGSWQSATALLTGFMAKEAVISSFAVLLGCGTAELTASLGSLFTPDSAFVFLVFTLLYTPCVAAVATVKREMRSGWAALGMVVCQFAVAWVVALVVRTLINLFALL
jgi:ferrous iron transport protein B